MREQCKTPKQLIKKSADWMVGPFSLWLSTYWPGTKTPYSFTIACFVRNRKRK